MYRFWLLFSVALAPASAQAGQGSAPTPLGAIDALAACRKVSADTDRLACYDRAAGLIAGVRSSGDLLVLDRHDVVKRKKQRFGLTNPTDDVFGGGEADRATEVREVTTTITTVRPSSYGRFALQLADNSVWETIEPLPFPPDTGASITVKRATMGGFRAAIAGSRTVLVKRLR